MKKTIRLAIILLAFTAFTSCGKNNPFEVAKDTDGESNNNRPDGGKYIELELLEEPDLSSVKVGEDIIFKFSIKATYNEAANQFLAVTYEQSIDAGQELDHSVLGIFNTTNVVPASYDNLFLRKKYDKVQTETKTIDLGLANGPLGSGQKGTFEIKYRPKYIYPTTMKMYVVVKGFLKATEIVHKSKVFEYTFTPKE